MQFQFRVGNDGGGRSFTLHGLGRFGAETEYRITNKMAVREHRHRTIHHVGRADGAVRPKMTVITTGRVIPRTLDGGPWCPKLIDNIYIYILSMPKLRDHQVPTLPTRKIQAYDEHLNIFIQLTVVLVLQPYVTTYNHDDMELLCRIHSISVIPTDIRAMSLFCCYIKYKNE